MHHPPAPFQAVATSLHGVPDCLVFITRSALSCRGIAHCQAGRRRYMPTSESAWRGCLGNAASLCPLPDTPQAFSSASSCSTPRTRCSCCTASCTWPSPRTKVCVWTLTDPHCAPSPLRPCERLWAAAYPRHTNFVHQHQAEPPCRAVPYPHSWAQTANSVY